MLWTKKDESGLRFSVGKSTLVQMEHSFSAVEETGRDWLLSSVFTVLAKEQPTLIIWASRLNLLHPFLPLSDLFLSQKWRRVAFVVVPHSWVVIMDLGLVRWIVSHVLACFAPPITAIACVSSQQLPSCQVRC